MLGFRWTGAEPAELNDRELAVELGAVWEGDELVTYDMGSLLWQMDHMSDDYGCPRRRVGNNGGVADVGRAHLPPGVDGELEGSRLALFTAGGRPPTRNRIKLVWRHWCAAPTGSS